MFLNKQTDSQHWLGHFERSIPSTNALTFLDESVMKQGGKQEPYRKEQYSQEMQQLKHDLARDAQFLEEILSLR